jgi:hypothetical protein
MNSLTSKEKYFPLSGARMLYKNKKQTKQLQDTKQILNTNNSLEKGKHIDSKTSSGFGSVAEVKNIFDQRIYAIKKITFSGFFDSN